jgi:predicted nuclease of predicted toxin-antitoxin system
VKLLFDQNLSRDLIWRLADVYPGSEHVLRLGMSSTDDFRIWKFAAQEGWTVVTKDVDYAHLGMTLGPPPKVIWIRLGNCRVSALEDLLRQAFPAIEALHADPELAVLTLPLQIVP